MNRELTARQHVELDRIAAAGVPAAVVGWVADRGPVLRFTKGLTLLRPDGAVEVIAEPEAIAPH
jgi:hypothetical protein